MSSIHSVRTLQVTDLQQTSPPPMLYTMKNAAYTIGVSVSQMYNILNSGAIPFYKHGSKTVIRADDLKTYIDEITQPENRCMKKHGE